MRLALAEEGIPHVPNELEKTFAAHHGMVFRTAYRITGNAADAEDVLQTVFLRLVGRQEGVAVEQPESYLRRAAINASLDLIRSKQRAESVPLDERAGPGTGQAEQQELRQRLALAMATLEPRQAEVFALRFLEGYSNPEIARMTGMSRILVAVTLHRTRGKLQRELEQA